MAFLRISPARAEPLVTTADVVVTLDMWYRPASQPVRRAANTLAAQTLASPVGNPGFTPDETFDGSLFDHEAGQRYQPGRGKAPATLDAFTTSPETPAEVVYDSATFPHRAPGLPVRYPQARHEPAQPSLPAEPAYAPDRLPPSVWALPPARPAASQPASGERLLWVEEAPATPTGWDPVVPQPDRPVGSPARLPACILVERVGSLSAEPPCIFPDWLPQPVMPPILGSFGPVMLITSDVVYGPDPSREWRATPSGVEWRPVPSGVEWRGGGP